MKIQQIHRRIIMSHITSARPLSGSPYIKIASYLSYQEVMDFRLIRKMTKEETGSFGLLLQERAVLRITDFASTPQFKEHPLFNHIQYFSVDLCHLPRIDFSFIAPFYEKDNQSKCQSIVKLSFDNRSIPTEHLFDFLGRFPALTKLRLANYPNTCVRFIITHLTEQYFKNTFINLVDLDLSAHASSFPNVNKGVLASEELVSVALSFTLGACKSLRVLNLSGCEDLQNMLVDLINESRLPTSNLVLTNTFKNLQSLDLSQTNITDDDLKKILTVCHSLKSLNLMGCDALRMPMELNTENVENFLQKFSTLEEINLNDNPHLFKDDLPIVFSLFLSLLPEAGISLQKLSLKGNKNISHILEGQQPNHLERLFKNLTYIDLRGTGITDDTLQILKTIAPKLRQIEV